MTLSTDFHKYGDVFEHAQGLVGRGVYARPIWLRAGAYLLQKVLTELVVRLTGGGKPLNEELTALRHSQ
jgi:hypothetical protein